MRSLGSSSYQDVHKSGSEYDISQHNHPFSDGPKYNNSYDNINSTERTLEHYNSTGHHDNYLPSQDSRPPSTLYDANYVHRTCGSTWIIRSGPSNYISELPSTQTAHSVSYAIPLPPAAALASHNSSTCPSLGTPGGALSASLTSERVLLTPKSGMVPPSTGNIVSTNQTYCPESPSSASYTHPCSPKLRGTLWGLNGSAAEESKASLERILNSGGILCSKPSPHMNFPPNSSASDSFATPSSISAMETISSSANGFNALVSNTLSSQPFIPTLPTESTDSLRRYAPGSFDSHCQSFKRSTGSLTLNGILINGQP